MQSCDSSALKNEYSESEIVNLLLRCHCQDAFDVDDTSFLPKLYLLYNRTDCAYLPAEGTVMARELATLNRQSKANAFMGS